MPAVADSGKADFTLRIAPVEVEIAPGHRIKTTAYNGGFPGPVLRMTEGKPVTIDVYNDSKIAELVHWHGLWIPPEVDGAAEEGTPMLAPHTHQRYQFVPRPAGTRWYHSHIYAGRDLDRSTYTGQFGFLIIEGKDNPGRYDQEVLLALHGWDPYLGAMKGGGEGSLEVGYNRFTSEQPCARHGRTDSRETRATRVAAHPERECQHVSPPRVTGPSVHCSSRWTETPCLRRALFRFWRWVRRNGSTRWWR